MKYPDGNQPLDNNTQKSQNYSTDIAEINWVTIAKVYPPADIVIESLLKSHGIPLRIVRRDISQIPITVGPLAEVKIIVPPEAEQKARDLLQTIDAENFES